ncbi:MAG: epoxyqueuosine reductase QueH [Lachnoclostridium sp.]|nr:epoxyqueuosine reductase QueH [Lachnoclostridium sp.]
MNNKRNYQRELEDKTKSFTGKPKLLLHCCCAPCSSYTLEYLTKHFQISVFFYNPNISNSSEYKKRQQELKRFIREYPFTEPVEWMPAEYHPHVFVSAVKGMEHLPEGGKRCERCFELRLRETAQTASAHAFEYFCTTLSVSPYKNADLLMNIGERAANDFKTAYLPSDFKKKDGYRRSILLSKTYHLYRQNYCGCEFSKPNNLFEG